ncbi:MAG: hypothetical protein AABY03_01440 [Nanoarchaeota archaeon]
MGWFGKKEEKSMGSSSMPSLPELPRLPELPSLSRSPSFERVSLPNLPSYPNSSLGRKFSQNAIKDAVSGEKEDDFEEDEEDYSDEDEITPKPLQGFVKRNALPEEEYTSRSNLVGSFKRGGKMEPVFIRIDKYEDALNMFDDARKKIVEMEDLLKHIKKIKEDEYRELKDWETEIQKIKDDFEKVNRDIFSKI